MVREEVSAPPATDCCPGLLATAGNGPAAVGIAAPLNIPKPASLQPLADFQAWAERYAVAAPEEKNRLRAEGTRLAESRRATMAGLIKYDPPTALGAMLPYRLRQALPREIAANIERPVRGRGDLMVLGVRPMPGQSIEEPFVRTANVAGQDYRAYTYGKRLADISRTDVPILGVGLTLADGKQLLAVREEAFEVLDADETADLRTAQPNLQPVCPISGQPSEAKGDETAVDTGGKVVWLCSHGHIGPWLQTAEGSLVAAAGGGGNSGGTSPVVPATYTEGNKTFLAIRIRFSDQAANFDPASDATMQTELQTVVSQWATWSYGKLQGTFAFTPTLTLPQTEAWYAANGTDNAVLSAARTTAAAYADGGGAHPYDTANFDFDCVVFSSSQIGNYCGLGYVGGKGAWIKCTNAGVYLHEWGHNLGLWHANFWQVDTDSPIGTGTHIEYGSKYSTMGTAALNPYDTLERYTLHWLEPADVVTVSSNGTRRLYNADKSTLTGGHPYALRIYKQGLVYYVEYRPNWDPAGPHFSTTNGAMICWTQQSDELLDMNPLTSAGNDDASLLVGRSFNDPAQGLAVTVTAHGGTAPDDYLDVAVNFTNPANDSAPVALVTASSYAPATGVAVTLNAIASDPDGDPLAYAWDFGDGNPSVNNSASQTKSWATAGDYNVRCVVSDMKGKSSVQNVVIHVGTPSTFTVSGRVTLSNGTPVPDVLIQDTANHLAYTDAEGRYSLGPLNGGSYTLSATHGSWTLAAQFSNPLTLGPSAANMNFTATPPAATGGITLEHWDGINGSSVANLTSNAAYPNSPTYVTTLESLFEAPSDVADNYGQRARGWFKPPTTGAYTFYIASDDASELWLSTNDTAAGKVKIASITGYTNSRDWTANASQKSAAITLTAGQRYYIEALHKEGGGGDHLAVGVDFPGGAQHRPLETTYLDPITATTPVTPANTVTVTATDANASEAALDPGTFTFTRTGSTAAALTVYFDVTGTATYGSDFQPTGLSATFAAGSATATATVTPIDDAVSETSETVVLTLAPSLTYTLGATTAATVTIADNEPAQVSITATDPAADESGSNPGTFTVTRTGDSSAALTVNYTIGGSATNGSDYPTLGTSVTIPAGQPSAPVTIAPTADGVFEVAETVNLTLAGGAGYTIGSPNSATVTIAAAIGTGGGILREWWDNISGTNFVYDLTNLASYPGSPTGREIITTAFTTGQDRAESFGERWRAIYTAPVTGNYFFYIASDDYSELWLSTDATPERRQKIAYLNGSTSFQNWTANASQKSAAMPLVAGQRYYIEALFKEGNGGDHLSVGVEYPNGALERPIPAHRLDPFTSATALGAPWTAQDVGTTGAVGASGLETALLPVAPKHRYSLNGTGSAAIADGTTLTDSISGATATLRGAGAAYTVAGNGVDLPGGSSATQAYIDLPNGVVSGTYSGGTRFTSATYETWVTVQTTQNWSRLFDFGTNSAGEVTGPGGTFSSGGTFENVLLSANVGTALDQRLARSNSTVNTTRDASGTTILGTQVHYALVYDAADQNWRWYRNGVLMQVLPDASGLSLMNDVNNWLGRSNYSQDANADAAFNEFRIYNYALTEAQIRGNTAAGPDVVNTLNSGNPGPYLVNGSGTLSTSGATDAFQFTSQPLSGDWEIRGRLVSLLGGDANAVAGLMMREGSAANARHAFIGVKADGTGRFIARTVAAGNSTVADRTGLAIPQWLRLVRSGDTLTGFVSADGTAWTQVGATITLSNLAGTLQIGFAVASGATANDSALAQFDNLTLSPSPGNGDGFLYERFEGITGATVATLTSAAAYPNSPTLREVRSGLLEVPSGSLDSFGERLRGYFVAPLTGSYKFYLAADDTAELWLSTNDTAGGRVKIATVGSFTAFRQWNKFAAQESAALPLTAGQRYYLEVLHKDDTSVDGVSVGVLLPGGIAEFPMLASRLESYVPPAALSSPWSGADIGTPSVAGFSANFAPGYTGAGDALPAGPRNRYTFTGTASATVADGATLVDSVSGQHATLRGAGAAFDATGTGVSLPGGSSATQAYVDLPNGVVTGTINGGTAYASASYELWFTQRTNRAWCRVLDFGTTSSGEILAPGGTFTGSNYVTLSGNIISSPDQRLERAGSIGTTQGTNRDSYGATALNQLAHVVVTYDSSTAAWRWYRNGVLMAVLPDTAGVSALSDVNSWLGRSNFSADQNLDGVLSEFRIYGYALTPQQIQGNFATGPDVVNTVDRPVPRAPRHRWTFTGPASAPAADGTWIYDYIGGANALVRGTGATFAASGSGLSLPGGASSTQAYVDLPNGVASGTDNGGTRFTSVTYECWATQTAHQTWSRLWDFGTGSAGEIAGPGGTSTGTNFLHLATNNVLTPNPRLRRAAVTTDVQANATGATILNRLTHHVVAYDAPLQQWRWYANGVLLATLADTNGVSTLTDVNNWIGRSQFSADANWAGTIHEFRIYDYALPVEQVLANLDAGPSSLSVAPPGLSGSAVISGGGDIVSSAAADAFQFASQSMDGDGEIIARLISMQNVNTSAKAGVMIRESTAPGSRRVFLGLTPAGTGRYSIRTTAGANASATTLNSLTMPLWLRLVRKGDVLTGFTSPDGTAWTPAGTTTLSALPADVLVGLAVSSANTGLADANFDNIQIVRPTVTITPTQNAVEYPPVNGAFTVTRTWDTTSALTVGYLIGGSATAGTDYQALSGSVTIPAGQTSAQITLTPINDATNESPETIAATVLDASGYLPGLPSSATITLQGTETPTEAWQQSVFGANWNTPAIAGDTADPDGDGMNNLLERALVGNPNAPDSPPLVRSSVLGSRLSATFSRSTANTDLLVTVFGADTLAGPWTELVRSTAGAAFTVTTTGATVSETGTGLTRTVEVRDLYLTTDPAHPRRFLRVQVQH